MLSRKKLFIVMVENTLMYAMFNLFNSNYYIYQPVKIFINYVSVATEEQLSLSLIVCQPLKMLIVLWH